MKKIIICLLILCFINIHSAEKTTKNPPKKKGVVSKIGDAATRGYGWQLGKEAAKETIKGAKKMMNSETAKKIKEKTIETGKKIKDKVTNENK